MTADETTDAQRAEQIADEHPGWVCWLGQQTGSWWAQPPKAFPEQHLLWAKSLADLERQIREAESRYTP